jgi:hypothetical protein
MSGVETLQLAPISATVAKLKQIRRYRTERIRPPFFVSFETVDVMQAG